MATAPSSQDIRKTPLYDEHVKLKAKMVPFGGWNMPVSYESVLTEHKTVRENVGLFDVSHMGEVRVTGSDAERFLQYITINDVTKLKDGGGQYSAILNAQGGMLDDLIVYRLNIHEFFICVNASNTEKDFTWIFSQAQNLRVTVTNESNAWGQIAVQGPKSRALLDHFIPDIGSLAYTNIREAVIGSTRCLVARTGYTGEWGYELYVPSHAVAQVWGQLLAAKPDINAKPIGLGARDTLRLEACYLLYGNDMNESVSPLEAGIAWATKLDKGDFIGRSALIEQKEAGVKRKIAAFKMIDDGIPRHGMTIQTSAHRTAGTVTSGSVLPTVGGAGGMALVDTALEEGQEILVDIRGILKRAVLVKRPLYAARVK